MGDSVRHALLVVLATCVSSTAVRAAEPNGEPALSEFEGVDANRDGTISAAEHAAAARKMFRAADANHDGKITAEEMDEAYTQVTGRDVRTSDLSGAQQIRMVDRDDDGVLTASEHDSAAKEVFRNMDVNGDGQLTREEWTAGHAAIQNAAK